MGRSYGKEERKKNQRLVPLKKYEEFWLVEESERVRADTFLPGP